MIFQHHPLPPFYLTPQDSELLGDIKPEEMLSVARCEQDSSRTQDPKYPHCFEVNTQGRGYLFCADSEEEMMDWIKKFDEVCVVCGDHMWRRYVCYVIV